MKRIMSAIISLLIAILFVSCSDKTPPAAVGSLSSTQESSAVEKKTVELIDGITQYDTVPDMLRLYLANSDYGDDDAFTVTAANKYIVSSQNTVPVTLMWRYADSTKVQSATLLVSQNEDLSGARKYTFTDASVCSKNVYNSFTGTKYYWQVCATMKSGEEYKSEVASYTVKEGVRLIRMVGISNARDCGTWKGAGGNMKQGLLYRCAKMEGVTDCGKYNALDVLGIKTEIDLRQASEITDNSVVPQYGPLGEKVRFVHIPTASYSNFFIPSDSTVKLFDALADFDNYPVIFHCAAGADRTGTVALAVQALCGVSEADVTRDYEITPDRDRTYDGFGDMIKLIRKQQGDTFRDKVYKCLHDTCRVSAMTLSNIYNIMMTDSAIFKSNSLKVTRINAGENVSFDIDLRSSGGIKGVTLNGTKAFYTFKKGTLTVKAPNASASKSSGVITFNDGATLNFDVATN